MKAILQPISVKILRKALQVSMLQIPTGWTTATKAGLMQALVQSSKPAISMQNGQPASVSIYHIKVQNLHRRNAKVAVHRRCGLAGPALMKQAPRSRSNANGLPIANGCAPRLPQTTSRSTTWIAVACPGPMAPHMPHPFVEKSTSLHAVSRVLATDPKVGPGFLGTR
jgi:hypothetical protein